MSCYGGGVCAHNGKKESTEYSTDKQPSLIQLNLFSAISFTVNHKRDHKI